MGGVDKSDQNLSYYPCARNGQKIYYKKVFRHLLDMAIYNAFIIYQKSGNTTTHLEFRLKLMEGLIQLNCDPQSRPKKGRLSDNTLSRLTERHFPDYLPPTEKKESPTRRCVVCTRQKKLARKQGRGAQTVVSPCVRYSVFAHITQRQTFERDVLGLTKLVVL